MPNPNVRWEEVEQYNVGADLTMIDGRSTLVCAYIKNTNDMLVRYGSAYLYRVFGYQCS